jgi:benzodiazapine receptor
MKLHPVVRFIIALALPLLVGAIAGKFTTEAIPGWYENLNRPSFSPPNWVFAPVWTTLYLLMGISMFLIWSLQETQERNNALGIYWIQLFLNFSWSFLFFYFKAPEVAFVEIVLLWIFIIILIQKFYKLKPLAAYLNVPYLLWVSFATILTAAYAYLN